MALTVLQVAYPLAPVSIDTAGGAEQILAHLDRGLVARAHRSLVVAPDGSATAGTLLPIPAQAGPLDDAAKARAQAATGTAIARALDRYPVDLVHLHGIDALAYLPPPGVPCLITLHLPPDWYPPAIWHLDRPDTWLVPVSATQARACPADCAALLPPVPNGVPVDDLARGYRKRGYVAALGRICPEKGFEHAITAAEKVGMPLLLAGRLYDYESHRDYAERVLAPRLSRRARFLGPLGFRGKRRLMGAARAVLVPSLCQETSSLVAIEALACGTPVIAFDRGALGEVVRHGMTGFLVADTDGMAAALGQVDRIDPDACRADARARFGLDAMVEGYLSAYGRVLRRW